MRIGFWALLLLAIMAAGCGGTTSRAAREARPFTPTEYRIGVEDVLEIDVWKEPQLATTAPVRPDGKVTVPLAGEIQAAGKTAKELEEELAKRFSARITSPTVTVVVKEINASRVFVYGEVAKPGAYPMRGALSVVQVLALAGGLTEFADKNDIVILRRGDAGAQERLKLDLNDTLKHGVAVELAPGDTVVVP